MSNLSRLSEATQKPDTKGEALVQLGLLFLVLVTLLLI